jgi:hypothetical protein
MKQKTSYGRIKISIIGGFIVPGKKGMKAAITLYNNK